MFNLFKHELQSRIMGIIGWGIGLGLFGSMYILIWPEMVNEISNLADLSIYQTMGIDMTNLPGFLASVVVQYVPIVFGIYAIIAGTGTLAGEEDRGTLELLLATPLHRWQIITMKALAISIAMFLIVIIGGLIDGLSLAIISSTNEVTITSLELFGAVLSAWPITLAFMMMGLFMGAWLPNRRVAAAVMTVLFIANYFMTLLFGMTESLEVFEPLTLFHYFDTTAQIFETGIQASDVAVLLGLSLLFFILALIGFQRRDVTVGLWPWQRAVIAD